VAKTSERLSALEVAHLKEPGYYADGANLYFRVAQAKPVEGAGSRQDCGARGWIFRFSRGGRARDMGLGAYPQINLAAARKLAAKCRELVSQGIDPIEQRRAAKAEQALSAAKVMTFNQAAEAYVMAHRAGWRNPKHAKQWTTTLASYAAPVLGRLPIGSIDVGLVMKVLEPIWALKPETAGRVRGRIEAVLDWAAARGYRAGENPARWRGHLDKLLPARSKVRKVKHHPALPYEELPAFLAELREQEGVAARALEYTILTAARTNETIGAQLPEIDMAAKVWTIPGERMKAERDHRVPLSAPALSILKRMGALRDSKHLFPGGRRAGLSNMAMLELLRGMNERRAKKGKPKWLDPRQGREIVPHGFRSTFRDWAAERTNFPSEVTEMALAHAVEDETEAAYRRGDLFEKRRRLMEAWARHCAMGAVESDAIPLNQHPAKFRAGA
jgi:integrase